MSRADSLAGLAEVIAGHDGYWTMYPVESGRLHWKVTCSGCESVIGEGRTPSPGLIAFADIHRAHVAAVALAWLEGHGWTEGTEEWGTRDRNGHVRTHMFKPSAERLAEIDHREVVRRRVSAWAPVETGEGHR